MLIIGEKINATRKPIARALEARNARLIKATVEAQVQAGADYIDLNGGDPRPGREAQNIAWLLETVRSVTDKPVAIDTADGEAMKIGLRNAGPKPILNSISLEASRLEPMLPLAAEHDCMVIALLMSDAGTPAGVDDRLANAEQLIAKLTEVGKKLDEIIVDPCFLPVSTDTNNGRAVIDAIARIRQHWPDVHIGGGCSNISFGLPQRKFINIAALCQAIYHGMDVGLIDPTIPGVVEAIRAAEAVAGRDEYCMNYVQAMR